MGGPYVRGFLEITMFYGVAGIAATALRNLPLPPFVDQNYVTVVVLSGLAVALLLASRHDRRGAGRRAAGAYAAAGFWPMAAVVLVVGRFAWGVIGWGINGV